MEKVKLNYLKSELNHENKIKRRKSLEEILDILQKLQNDSNNSEAKELLNVCHIPLIKGFHDESEVNRNKVTKIFIEMSNMKILQEEHLDMILPSIQNNMNKSATDENCEENRLEYLILLQRILINVQITKVGQYADNYVEIIKYGLSDKYSDVVFESCNLIITLASTFKNNFKMFSNSFVAYVVKNLSNRKFRIRVKAINTLGCIFIHGDCQELGEAITCLSKIVHDIPQVRLELISTGFLLATEMPDRYSFWGKIFPLILFGLDDDDPEIRKSANSYWEKIGLKYESENEEIERIQSGYTVKAGCSELMRKSFHSMLPRFEGNIHHWQTDVRLHTIKLLFVCINELAFEGIQYATRILDFILFSASDQDERIASKAIQCAESLGAFVPPDVYVRSVQDNLFDEKSNFLFAFASMISKTPQALVMKDHEILSNCVKFTNVPSNINLDMQENLFSIVQLLIENTTQENFNIDLYFTFFYLMGSKNNISPCSIDQVFNTQKEFFHNNVSKFLTKIKESENSWDENCPELAVFSALATLKGFENHFQSVSSILSTKLSKDSDPLILFIVLQTVEKIIGKLNSPDTRQLQQQWAQFSIQELVCDQLPWRSGKTAQSLRMTCVSHLNAILQSCNDKDEFIFEALEPVFKILKSLITDELKETRILSCKLIEILFHKYFTNLNLSWFLSSFNLIGDRLDDKCLSVRQVASNVLAAITAQFPFMVEAKQPIGAFMEKIYIYVLEEEVAIQNNIFKTLGNLAQNYSEEFNQLLNSLEEKNFKEKDAPLDSHFVKQIQNLKRLRIN